MKKRIAALSLSFVLGFCMIFAMSGCSSETYTPQLKPASVSTPTIKTSGTLTVGVNADNPPFAGQSSGKIVGLDVDVAAALADELGLKLQVKDIGSDPDKALKDGTVDIVMGVDKSDSSVKCWKSDAYIQSGVALFAASADAAVPTAASNPKIAAQVSSMSAWEVNKQFGDTALVTTKDLKEAFKDLSDGTVKYVAADAVIGTYATYTGGNEAYIVAMMQKPSGYAVGALDTNTTMKTTISDTLKKLISNGTIDVIQTKWLGKTLDLSKVPLTAGTDAGAAATTTPPTA